MKKRLPLAGGLFGPCRLQVSRGNLLRLVLYMTVLVASVRATSVLAPSFEDLVKESAVVVRGRVKSVDAAWVETAQGRVIKTTVVFEVLKRLKGDTAPELTLQFLGGEVGGEGMHIAGMPRFAVGQIDLVFVSGSRRRICPLTAMMHGRYRVLTDGATKREYIARNDGVPLVSEHDVRLPQPGNALVNRQKSVSVALSPDDFERRITAEVARHAILH